MSERSHQVAQMRTIYEEASCVLMWLGDAYEDSDLAMGWLIRNETILFKNIHHGGTDALDFWKDDEFVPHIQALEKLTARNYWKRLWILQEVILGREAFICCGNYRASWMPFLNAFTIGRHQFFMQMKETNGGNPLFPSICLAIHNRIRPIAKLWAKRMKKLPVSFLESLVDARERDATDDRDHVYGVLGFVDSAIIEVDYTEAVFKMYRDMTIKYIDKTRNLDILTACKRFDAKNPPWKGVLEFDTSTPSLLRARGAKEDDPDSIERAAREVWEIMVAWQQEPESTPYDMYCGNETEKFANYVGLRSLPSWVPRWDEKVQFDEYILLGNLDCNYSAGGFSTVEYGLPLGGRLLVLKGVCFDVVDYVRRPVRDGQELLESLRHDWQIWCSMYRDRGENPYGDTEYQLDAYRNTITFGKDPVADENVGDENWFKRFFHKRVMEWGEDFAGDLEDLNINGSRLNNGKLIERSFHSLWKGLRHRLFITRCGYLGLGPLTMEKGDMVCIFLGGKVPFIIRKNDHIYFPQTQKTGEEANTENTQEERPTEGYQCYFLLGEAWTCIVIMFSVNFKGKAQEAN
jgi:hypothetical protein